MLKNKIKIGGLYQVTLKPNVWWPLCNDNEVIEERMYNNDIFVIVSLEKEHLYYNVSTDVDEDSVTIKILFKEKVYFDSFSEHDLKNCVLIC